SRPERVVASSNAGEAGTRDPSDESPKAEKPRAPRPDVADAVEAPASSDRPTPETTMTRTVEPATVRSAEEPARADAPPTRTERVSTPPETPKTPPVARDIRLEFAGADRKVEVRLMERAGEVHFAVRTPDDRLAGALREDLPSLSSRLEQSGFRAEGWHGGTDAGGERRLDVPTSQSSADGRESGQRQD